MEESVKKKRKERKKGIKTKIRKARSKRNQERERQERKIKNNITTVLRNTKYANHGDGCNARHNFCNSELILLLKQ